ncbi:unnamed protein product [Urochloa decumbens]|uniref:DUF295 domain-containing protein n=1 Tax=Urochloa decumbens TaxID=240449 RepID=A0ABC9E5P2_9POAL
MASTKRSSSSWSDLPPDLLGLVLRRLHSLADRVRVNAVCRPWRSAARLQEPPLPPPMPWISLWPSRAPWLALGGPDYYLDLLIAIEIADGSGGGNPAISGVKDVIKHACSDGHEEEESESWGISLSDNPFAFLTPRERYLVPSGDQLLMVQRWSDWDNGSTNRFGVHEADLAASPCRWTTPTYILDGSRALFLGRCGSKSVPAAGCSDSDEPREDCIYFLRGPVPGSESGVYDMCTGKLRELGTGGNTVPWGAWIPTWVFSDRSAPGSGRYD